MAGSPELAHEAGSSSILFIGVIIPVILALLLLSIDLAGFFQVREQVRALLDDEAEVALVQGRDSGVVVDATKARLRAFNPLLTTSSVIARVTSAEATVSLDATYRGVVLDLTRSLLAKPFRALPVQLSVTARRARSSALILLERYVADQFTRCSDEGLSAAKRYVGQLRAGLRSQGFSSVSVVITPGSQAPLGSLEDGYEGDPCEIDPQDEDPEIAAIPGSPNELPMESEIVAGIEARLDPTLLSVNPERLAVIALTRGRYAGGAYLHPLVEALDRLGEREHLEVSFLHVGIDPVGAQRLPIERSGEYGSRRREVLVAARVLGDAQIIAASLGYLGGDSIISR